MIRLRWPTMRVLVGWCRAALWTLPVYRDTPLLATNKLFQFVIPFLDVRDLSRTQATVIKAFRFLFPVKTGLTNPWRGLLRQSWPKVMVLTPGDRCKSTEERERLLEEAGGRDERIENNDDDPKQLSKCDSYPCSYLVTEQARHQKEQKPVIHFGYRMMYTSTCGHKHMLSKRSANGFVKKSSGKTNQIEVMFTAHIIISKSWHIMKCTCVKGVAIIYGHVEYPVMVIAWPGGRAAVCLDTVQSETSRPQTDKGRLHGHALAGPHKSDHKSSLPHTFLNTITHRTRAKTCFKYPTNVRTQKALIYGK
ncbi:hypothetical protein RRG08_048406 [Elysia crispata]|uniref:Secreted protein n=1 Tax=Elysia crispata TaxID=231223 RepID=A0AAE1B8M6_9GAST|nr:hypothetical protein RRG08_048406 [Elysia crispata]